MSDIIDILIFLTFFLSFYSKVQNVIGFGVEIASYRIFNFQSSRFFAYLVLFAELSLLICYWLDRFQFIRSVTVISLLILFSLFALHKKRKLKVNTCSCFGDIDFLNKYPVLRNMVLIILVVIGFSIGHYWDIVHVMKGEIMVIIINIIILIDVVLHVNKLRGLSKHVI